MQVTVKGRNTRVSKGIKEMATNKIEHIQRFFDRIDSAQIEFSTEPNPRHANRKHKVEVTLAAQSHVLRAHATGPDPATAVDRVVAKLETQVHKLKDKTVSRGNRTSGKARVARTAAVDTGAPKDAHARNGEDLPLDSQYEAVPDDEKDAQPRITRVKRFAVKPMTATEAVLQMQSLGRDFYLFINAESEQAGVVYQRRDGSFGLIEPEAFGIA